MKAPFTRFPILIFCLAIIISTTAKAQAEQISFEVRIGQGTEAVHFPLQHNPIGEGKITRVPSSLTFEISVTSGEPKQFSACPHFLAVVGPAGMSADTTRKLNDWLKQSLQTPTVKDFIAKGAYEASPSTPAELAQEMKTAYDKWGEMVKMVGLVKQ